MYDYSQPHIGSVVKHEEKGVEKTTECIYSASINLIKQLNALLKIKKLLHGILMSSQLLGKTIMKLKQAIRVLVRLVKIVTVLILKEIPIELK
ncbi:MAG: hypothetical protein A2044_04800 [Candidatus Firestonebacteria bacterium GWA2_43_8]|nr:MAG: hypothetical protein A2044_04800 [Candidatus Firestonebacteria bacterium GWA2_43_8]